MATADFAPFHSRRSVVHSSKGIVSCTQPLAARCGIKVLQQGGNAADAAVATAAALNVTEPSMTGIGGDCFCLFYDAKAKRTRAINGSGRSPAGLSLETLRKDLGAKDGKPEKIPESSVHSATIPGAPGGWADTVERFGSGKLSLLDVLMPAIELAEEGFPVSEISAWLWGMSEDFIKDASPNYSEMLKADSKADRGCRAPRKGEIFRNPGMAKTFRLLGEHGKKGFYEGPVAEAYVKAHQDRGGYATLEDLKFHLQSGEQEVEPISYKFQGQGLDEAIELWEHPPNGQGLVALMALGMLDELEKAGKIRKFTRKDHNSTEYLHVLIEVLRLAFSDGTHYIADPKKVPVPIKSLLEPSYLASRVASFSPKSAIRTITHGAPYKANSDTVYLSVSDPYGNAASFINSNYSGFGTAIIPKGFGFTMQNRGSGFEIWPDKSHPNIYAPRKRPYHTIIPAMITNPKDGSLNTCYGVMGKFMQPQGHLQVLMNMFVFGMNEQEALDAPRICIEPPRGASGEQLASLDFTFLEEGIPDETVHGLQKLGHDVKLLKGQGRHQFGRGQVIRKVVHEDGSFVWSAGSDLRADGQASPL